MNHTDTVKAHKLSAGMVAALMGAVFREHATGNGEAGYVIHDMHPRTRKALHDRGLMYGHYYLTRTGVEALATLSGNTVDVRGYEWDGNKLRVAAYVETYADDMATVAIQGDAPDTWAPDMSAVIDGCYFTSSACVGAPVALFVDYVGRTEGVCVAHRDRVEGATYELPTVPVVDAHTDAESVSEAVEGDTVEPFVFLPGIHALDMGDNSYNRFCGIGESSAVAGSLYTYGLATAISAHPGMGGTGKVNIPCEFGDVITVRTSLGDTRFVVSDNRYGANGEGSRKGDPILTPYATDDARCYVCQTHGDNSMPGKNIEGEWVCGYCVANYRTPANLNSHSLVFYVETENAGIKFSCDGCGGINNRAPFAEFECDGETDGGFVETESVDDYSAVAALSTGAGFHTVPDAPQGTGTTHHSMDAHGGQWTRFEHVLSVGDIVRSTESGRALYEVYALIPGLPVVYVDPCDGREPFPMGATSLYAL